MIRREIRNAVGKGIRRGRRRRRLRVGARLTLLEAHPLVASLLRTIRRWNDRTIYRETGKAAKLLEFWVTHGPHPGRAQAGVWGKVAGAAGKLGAK